MTFEIGPDDFGPTDEDFDELGLPPDVRDELRSKLAARGSSVELPKELLEKLGAVFQAHTGGFRRPEPFPSAVSFTCTEPEGSTYRRTWEVFPQQLFRGEGLWLWGVDSTTRVHAIKCGLQNCFALTHAGIPGLYFQAGMSFADFEQLLEKIPGGWTHQRLRELPPIPDHQRIRMHTAEIGNSLLLDVEGPLTHAVMWGKTVD